MDSARYQDIAPYLFIDSAAIRKIPVNQADANLLEKHPYLNWNQAKAIFNYRQQHGAYQNIESLKSVHLVNDSMIEKLMPYLDFE